ncbi:hypothetical protein SAMN04488055_1250 [Chitinophaga niabensis]|uniref:Terpene synthase n=2 Tax=Chitinophaga niabensis TaxID=536979 RepID=A0A1N6E2E2_9BACT|nr:hypothetical protein SAMN04488055_1250 [Chitinophaga niabensis]
MSNENALQFAFPHAVNPAGNEMEVFIDSSINEHYYFLPAIVRKKYSATGIGHCAACTYPKADPSDLKIICAGFLWCFTVDDLFEHSSFEKIQEVERISLEFLRFGKLVSDDPLYAPLIAFRKIIIDRCGEEWLQKRICHSLELYFKGMKEAISYRKSNVFPSMEAFYDIRVNDVNVWIMASFAEMITGTILPDEIINHPSVYRLGHLTARILSWENDYFSAHHEDGNEVFNLALIIKHYSGCSGEQANAELLKIHDQDVHEFEITSDGLPDFGRYNDAVRSYVDNLRYMISGYLFWTLELTARYKAGGHPSIDIRKVALTQ